MRACDVYAGHQHLHLRDEEQARTGIAEVEKGTEQWCLHFLHHACRTRVRDEAQFQSHKNEQTLLHFLIPLSILPFGTAVASEYGEIRVYLQRSGTPIEPLDMLDAAHARSEDMILVTNNIREFDRVPDLDVENCVE